MTDADTPPTPGPSGRRIVKKGFELVGDGAAEAPAGFELVDAGSDPTPASPPAPLPPLSTPRAVRVQPFVLHRAPVQTDDGVGAASGASAGCLLLVGLVSLGIFSGLFHVGQSNKWTSDGPGMLCPMIGVLVFGLMTVLSFGGAAVALLGSLLPGWMRR